MILPETDSVDLHFRQNNWYQNDPSKGKDTLVNSQSDGQWQLAISYVVLFYHYRESDEMWLFFDIAFFLLFFGLIVAPIGATVRHVEYFILPCLQFGTPCVKSTTHWRHNLPENFAIKKWRPAGNLKAKTSTNWRRSIRMNKQIRDF